MRRDGFAPAVRALTLSIALLLPAAVVAATTSGPPTAPDRDIGAAALGGGGDAGASTAPTSTTPASTTTPTVALPPSPTTTAPRPAVASPTTSKATVAAPVRSTTPPRPTPSTLRPSTSPPPPGTPAGPDMLVRLRTEPTTPAPGDFVAFYIDVSTSYPCCSILLNFGDGSPDFWVDERYCGPQAPYSVITRHMYLSPGSYKVTLWAVAGSPACAPAVTGGSAPPLLVNRQITTCVTVGPQAPKPC